MSESAHLLLVAGLLFFDMKRYAAIDGLGQRRDSAPDSISPNGVRETFKEEGLVYTTCLRIVSPGGIAAPEQRDTERASRRRKASTRAIKGAV